MFSLFKGKDYEIELQREEDGERFDCAVKSGETILNAALENNIEFPHSCKVGGCATCRCRLVSGEIRELTDRSYVLTKEEMDQGYILACQSVPKSNVKIEFKATQERRRRRAS